MDLIKPENIRCTELEIKGAAMAKKHRVGVKEIPLNKIKLGKNSRMNVSKEEIAGMMESIKEQGLLQPIGVVPVKDHYEVCYGNRRFLAASKLGMPAIPCMVHDTHKASDVDMMNLTENIQRRNLSLTEAGRYIFILKEHGLADAEIVVRLGVSKSYVDACMRAYQDVPAEFREDLEMQVGGRKLAPGKIAMTTARALLSAEKEYHLTSTELKTLFKAAKADSDFDPANIRKYAQAIKSKKKDPIRAVSPVKKIVVPCMMTEDEYNRIWDKHVENGPYSSVAKVCRAILTGHLSARVKLLDKETSE